jgi:hypothetical protein
LCEVGVLQQKKDDRGHPTVEANKSLATFQTVENHSVERKEDGQKNENALSSTAHRLARMQPTRGCVLDKEKSFPLSEREEQPRTRRAKGMATGKHPG